MTATDKPKTRSSLSALSGARPALRRFLADRAGATAIEYGLIVSLITLAIIGSLGATGGGVSGAWNNVMTKAGEALNRN